MAFANSGLPVLLKEVDPVALERGMARIRKNDEKFGKAWAHHSRGKGSAPRFDSAEVELRGFNDSDLIIEAVFESLELKKQIFAELEKIAKPECVLATNTSVLDIDTIAQSTSPPRWLLDCISLTPRTSCVCSRLFGVSTPANQCLPPLFR